MGSTCKDFELGRFAQFPGEVKFTEFKPVTLTTTGEANQIKECKALCTSDKACGLWSKAGNVCRQFRVDIQKDVQTKFNGLVIHPSLMYNSGFPNNTYDASIKSNENECKNDCQSDPQCNFYTFDTETKVCLKNSCTSPFPTGYVKGTKCVGVECLKGKEYYYSDPVNNILIVYKFDPNNNTVQYFNSTGLKVQNGSCHTYTYTISADNLEASFSYYQRVYSGNWTNILKNITPAGFDEYDTRLQYMSTDPNRWDFTRFILNPGETLIRTCSPIPRSPPPSSIETIISSNPPSAEACPDIFECVKNKEFSVANPLSVVLGDTIIVRFFAVQGKLIFSLGSGTCLLTDFTVNNNYIIFRQTLTNKNNGNRIPYEFRLYNYSITEKSVDLIIDRLDRSGTGLAPRKMTIVSSGTLIPSGSCSSVNVCTGVNNLPYCEDGSDPNNLTCSDGTLVKCFDMCSRPEDVCTPLFTTTLKFMNRHDFSDKLTFTPDKFTIQSLSYRYFVERTSGSDIFIILTPVDTFVYTIKDIEGVKYRDLLSLETNKHYIEFSVYFYKRTIIAPVTGSFRTITIPSNNDCGTNTQTRTIEDPILFHCYMFHSTNKASYYVLQKSVFSVIHNAQYKQEQKTFDIDTLSVSGYDQLISPFENLTFNDLKTCSYSVDTFTETMNVTFDSPLNTNNILEEVFFSDKSNSSVLTTGKFNLLKKNNQNVLTNYGTYLAIYNFFRFHDLKDYMGRDANNTTEQLFRMDGQIDMYIKFVDNITNSVKYFRVEQLNGNWIPEDVQRNVWSSLIVSPIDVNNKNISVANYDTEAQNLKTFFDSTTSMRFSICKLRNINEASLYINNLVIQSNCTIGNFFLYENQILSGLMDYNISSTSIKNYQNIEAEIQCTDIYDAVEKCTMKNKSIGFEWDESTKKARILYLENQFNAITNSNDIIKSHIEGGKQMYHTEGYDVKIQTNERKVPKSKYYGGTDGSETKEIMTTSAILVHNIFPKNCVSPINDMFVDFNNDQTSGNKLLKLGNNNNPSIPTSSVDNPIVFNTNNQSTTKRIYIRSTQPNIGGKFFIGIPLLHMLPYKYVSKYGEVKSTPVTINVSSIKIDGTVQNNVNILFYRMENKNEEFIGKTYGTNNYIVFKNYTQLELIGSTSSYTYNKNTKTLTINGTYLLTYDDTNDSFTDGFGIYNNTTELLFGSETYFITTEDGSIIDNYSNKNNTVTLECLWYAVLNKTNRRKIFLISVENSSKSIELDLNNDFSYPINLDRYPNSSIELNPLDFSCKYKAYDDPEISCKYEYVGNDIILYKNECINGTNKTKILRRYNFDIDGKLYDDYTGYIMEPQYNNQGTIVLDNCKPLQYRIANYNNKCNLAQAKEDYCDKFNGPNRYFLASGCGLCPNNDEDSPNLFNGACEGTDPDCSDLIGTDVYNENPGDQTLCQYARGLTHDTRFHRGSFIMIKTFYDLVPIQKSTKQQVVDFFSNPGRLFGSFFVPPFLTGNFDPVDNTLFAAMLLFPLPKMRFPRPRIPDTPISFGNVRFPKPIKPGSGVGTRPSIGSGIKPPPPGGSKDLVDDLTKAGNKIPDGDAGAPFGGQFKPKKDSTEVALLEENPGSFETIKRVEKPTQPPPQEKPTDTPLDQANKKLNQILTTTPSSSVFNNNVRTGFVVESKYRKQVPKPDTTSQASASETIKKLNVIRDTKPTNS